MPTPDMDQTVSRCSKPSSRTALMGEQPNPWSILQPQVAKSQHRVTALPLGTVGSLRPTFVPARRVGLAVKLSSAFELEGQSPKLRVRFKQGKAYSGYLGTQRRGRA
ncbi:hypothetical protein TIFTF001_017589 [Ficus carica]|uniref:Uncharacterized protein n=1 Tax=Ficus carica TaxID=3494 RepID=A0AA88A2L4_FICCA|nr:hypothetical protein TIFTF001_017589 [Ficus carica]